MIRTQINNDKGTRGSRAGFTLVELLVVIAIIGLLANIVLVSLASARLKSRTTKRITDLRQLATALELYNIAYGGYPNSGGNWDLIPCTTGWPYGDQTNDWIPGLSPEFISQLPQDPRNNTVCAEQYKYRSDGTDYKLIARPEQCSVVKSKYPNLIDPMRDCWAFGFWTSGAEGW